MTHPEGTKTLAQRFGSAFELPQTAGRIPAMEGLRGVAVLMVFCVHFVSSFGRFAGPYRGLLDFLHDAGPAGVDLFFLLSSFLVYGILLRKRGTYGAFLRRRAQRIYPAFLAVFGIYLLAGGFLDKSSKLPHGFLNAAGYIAANLIFLPGIFDIRPIITVAWSLSYEFLSYLLFPGLVWLLRMANWSPRQRALFWCGLGVLLSALAYQRRNYLYLHCTLMLFTVGPVLYEYVHAPKRYRFRLWQEPLILLSCVGSLLFLHLSRFHYRPIVPRVAIAVTFGLLVAYALTRAGAIGRALRVAPLRWLGNMSYSYYLVHGLAILAFHYVVVNLLHWQPGANLLLAVVLPVCLAVTLGVSALLFLWVEKPYSLMPPLRAAKQKEAAMSAMSAP